MKSPRQTKTGGIYDLLLEDGKFQFCEDGTQAAQHAMERILFFKGELSLNGALTTKTELGTKAYEIVFDMSKSKAEKILELKSRILGTPGVKKIISFIWEQAAHTVTITSKIQTAWGAETVSTTVTPL